MNKRRKTIIIMNKARTNRRRSPEENNYVTRGLVKHFDGINNTGSGYSESSDIFKDLVGNNDGKLIGVPVWVENGLKLSGDDPLLKVEFRGDITSDYTISCVHQIDKMTTHPRLWGDPVFPSCFINSNTRRYSNFSSGRDAPFEPFTLAQMGVKTQVTIRYSQETRIAELFIKGVKVAELDNVPIPRSVPTAYLGNNAAANRGLDGVIYNNLYYGLALTDSEIMSNYLVDKERFGI